MVSVLPIILRMFLCLCISQTCIQSLPSEVLVRIARQLDITDLRNLAHSAQDFMDIAHVPSLWRELDLSNPSDFNDANLKFIAWAGGDHVRLLRIRQGVRTRAITSAQMDLTISNMRDLDVLEFFCVKSLVSCRFLRYTHVLRILNFFNAPNVDPEDFIVNLGSQPRPTLHQLCVSGINTFGEVDLSTFIPRLVPELRHYDCSGVGVTLCTRCIRKMLGYLPMLEYVDCDAYVEDMVDAQELLEEMQRTRPNLYIGPNFASSVDY